MLDLGLRGSNREEPRENQNYLVKIIVIYTLERKFIITMALESRLCGVRTTWYYAQVRLCDVRTTWYYAQVRLCDVRTTWYYAQVRRKAYTAL